MRPDAAIRRAGSKFDMAFVDLCKFDPTRFTFTPALVRRAHCVILRAPRTLGADFMTRWAVHAHIMLPLFPAHRRRSLLERSLLLGELYRAWDSNVGLKRAISG